MYKATKKRVKESKNVVYVTNEFLQRRYPTIGESINCSNVALTEFDEKVLENRTVNVRYKGQQYIIVALGS